MLRKHANSYGTVYNTVVEMLVAGWLFKMELTNKDEASSLMDEKAYEELVKEQSDD